MICVAQVKAVVRAMDTVQAYANAQHGTKISSASVLLVLFFVCHNAMRRSSLCLECVVEAVSHFVRALMGCSHGLSIRVCLCLQLVQSF